MTEEQASIIPFQSGKALSCGPAVTFNRQEIQAILNVYGKMVSRGHWKDYALDVGRERAIFSVYKRASERPEYKISKDPSRAHKQGAYAVYSAQGQILKRGKDLLKVLGIFNRKLIKLV